MARLRVSSRRLEIEAGRWCKPYKPVNERKCKLCNCLEDEFRFVIECNFYLSKDENISMRIIGEDPV